MKFIAALSALPSVTAGSLRKLKSDPDALFNLLSFTPPPAPETNDFFTVTEEEPKLQQSSFTATLNKNNGDSKFMPHMLIYSPIQTLTCNAIFVTN